MQCKFGMVIGIQSSILNEHWMYSTWRDWVNIDFKKEKKNNQFCNRNKEGKFFPLIHTSTHYNLHKVTLNSYQPNSVTFLYVYMCDSLAYIFKLQQFNFFPLFSIYTFMKNSIYSFYLIDQWMVVRKLANYNRGHGLSSIVYCSFLIGLDWIWYNLSAYSDNYFSF